MNLETRRPRRIESSANLNSWVPAFPIKD
jgi:hypothetical protein